MKTGTIQHATVGDLIEYLSRFDKSSRIVVYEPNAFESSMWQVLPVSKIGLFACSVKEEKERAMRLTKRNLSDLQDYLDNEFNDLNDDDLILRF